jgi:non-specific serine/threonine protein kinase
MLEVRLLGKFDLRQGGKAITIASRPAQSLFAYLILSAGTSHRREKLAGLLWPDSLEETARENLRHALWRLRKALEAASSTRFLHADNITISFKESPDYWLDAAELEKLSENATSDELMVVLSNYEGELLPGFYDEWVVLEREHLGSIFEHHMARLISLLQEEKHWLGVLDWGERWIKLGQKPEPAYRALMVAHAAKEDMSKVAAIYERCVKSLKEFGIQPSEQTRALYERLKAGKEKFETRLDAPVREKRTESPRTNLPIPITSFIGREKEVDQIVELLRVNRLVTLTGPGGVGKTRLAIQSSKQILYEFKDGVWWVELAPLIDEVLVPQAAAQVWGLREAAGQLLIETLKSYLKEKELLLVLDNCEHLIDACAKFSQDLLTRCAKLRILTTSREALDIMGETEYQVQPLSMPMHDRGALVDLLLDYEGIRLFVERAKAKSGFALTEHNASTVLQICQRLDGIPLAIELASARTKSMSVENILEHLNDRFNLLTQGNRAALPRHQTLRTLIDWSYDLLSEPEKNLFQRLSVFAGGFTVDAVKDVAVGSGVLRSQVINLLGQLIDKSLVTLRAGLEDSKPETRYGMLETIREYARDKLNESGEMEELRHRHRDYFIALAEQAEPKLKGVEQFKWLDRLELEHDNLRAAWHCAIESDAALALRIVSALFDFWYMLGSFGEGRIWLAKLIEQTSQWGQTAGRAHVLSMAGWFAAYQRDLATARPLSEQALAVARGSGNKKEIAFALLGLGATAHWQRDDQVAHSYLTEALTLYQELKDQWGIAWTLFQLPSLSYDDAEGEELFLRSLAKFRGLGDRFRMGRVLNDLGELIRLRGDYERAGKVYEEALETLRATRSGVALPTINLAWVWLHRGNYRKAKALFQESLKLTIEYQDKIAMLLCLGGFAAILGMIGKPQQAVCLFGALESLLESSGMAGHLDTLDQKEIDHYVAVVRAQLAESAFTSVWSEGRKINLEQAIEFALKETEQ